VFIGCSDFNKDVLGIDLHLGGIRVDDGRHGKHYASAVPDDGHSHVLVQLRNLLLQLGVRTLLLQQDSCTQHFLLFQSVELEGVPVLGSLHERALQLGEVVCPDGHEFAPAADVLVQFVLQGDERVLGGGGEVDSAQDACDHSGANTPYFGGNGDAEELTLGLDVDPGDDRLRDDLELDR